METWMPPCTRVTRHFPARGSQTICDRHQYYKWMRTNAGSFNCSSREGLSASDRLSFQTYASDLGYLPCTWFIQELLNSIKSILIYSILRTCARLWLLFILLFILNAIRTLYIIGQIWINTSQKLSCDSKAMKPFLQTCFINIFWKSFYSCWFKNTYKIVNIVGVLAINYFHFCCVL